MSRRKNLHAPGRTLFEILEPRLLLSTTILFEGFEGSFPWGNGWTVTDADTYGAPAYWGAVNYAFGDAGAHSGSGKGYCAAAGYGGSTVNPQCQSGMMSDMSRTIDLRGYSSAWLDFWYMIPDMDPDTDYASVYVDNTMVWGYTDVSDPWYASTVDLSDFVGGVHTLKFEYGSLSTYEGMYLDDIKVRGISDDSYEGNDSRAEVDSRPEGGTNSPNLGLLTDQRVIGNLEMEDAADWYKFRIGGPGATGSSVGVEYASAQGDLDVAVYRADGTTLVGSTALVSDCERVSLSGQPAGTYYVKVSGHGGTHDPDYSLVLDPGPPSESTNYAVLFSGGMDYYNNTPSFYDNIRGMYAALVQNCAIEPSHIYLLFADGTNYEADDYDYNSDLSFAVGSHVLEATAANTQRVLVDLADRMDGNDAFFFFANDHGGGTKGNTTLTTEETLVGWDCEIDDNTFATWTSGIHAGRSAYIFSECYSGGMIDDLMPLGPGEFACASANHYENSYADYYVGGIPRDFSGGILYALTQGYRSTYDIYNSAFQYDDYSTDGEGPAGRWTDGVEHPWKTGYDFPIFSPVLVATSSPLAYTENSGAVRIAPSLAMADMQTGLTGATVQITGNYQNGQDVLSFTNTAKITATWDPTTGTLTLAGSDTAAHYLTALQSVKYTNTSDNPSTLARTVSFTASDSISAGNSVTQTINVIPVNDAPTLDAVANPTPVEEGAGEQTVNLAGITAGGGESQALQVTVASGNTALIPNPTVTYTSPDATGHLTYTPVVGSNGTAVITVTVRDAGLDGIMGNADDGQSQRTFTVMVTPVNDPPVNIVPGSQTVDEDAGLVFSPTGGNGIGVSDVDAGTGQVRVTLTATGGILWLGTTAGLASVAGNGSATVTMTGMLVNLNAALRGLIFRAPRDYSGPAGLQIATDDQGNTGYGGPLTDIDTISITVNPVNDAPVARAPNSQTVDPSGSLTFSSALGNAVTVCDVDAGTAALQVTLTATNGVLAMGPAADPGSVTGNGTGVVTILGTAADLNAAMDGMVFTPTTDGLVLAGLRVVVDDLGNTGAGGAMTDTADVSILVAAPAVLSSLGAPVILSSGGRWTFTDADGDLVTVSLSGGGTGLLFFGGAGPADLDTIALSDTTAGSALSVTVVKQGGGGRTTVGDIVVQDGSLASLTGSLVDLGGNVMVDGTLGTLTLGNLVVGTHRIETRRTLAGNPAARLSMTLGQVADTSVDTHGQPIESLRAIRWINSDGTADSIVAPWLGSLVTTGAAPAIRGNFGADLWLTGDGLSPADNVLGTARIGGDLTGSHWDVAGRVGNVTVSGATSGWNWGADGGSLVTTGAGTIKLGDVADADIVIDGAVRSLSAQRWLDGSLTAAKAETISIRGDLGADVTLTQDSLVGARPVLKRLSVAGWLTGNVISAGPVKSVTVGGINSAAVYAGVKDGVSGLPGAGDFNTFASAGIGTFTVRGIAGQTDLFIDADVAAWAMGSIAIKGVRTDNGGGAYFGVSAHSIRSFRRDVTSWPALMGSQADAVDGGFVLRLV